MKKFSPRTWTFIFTGIGLLALVLLAASLNTLQLAPGQPVSFNEIAPSVTDTGTANDWSRYLVIFFRVLMVIFWIAVPLVIILLILNKDARKRFLRDLAIMLPILLFLLYLSNHKQAQQTAQDLNNRMMSAPTLEQLQTTPAPPPPEFVPPPAWVTNLAAVLIAVAIVVLVAGVLYSVWRRAENQRRLKEPLQKVERQAQAAIDAIHAGGDLRETILRCYLQMVETLKEYRGIQRNYDMTPHEFELMLEKRGLPGEPVHNLTQLFEQVRYGAIRPGRQDETTAITSLSAIVSACQRTRNA